jgi:hypothetical protein
MRLLLNGLAFRSIDAEQLLAEACGQVRITESAKIFAT